MKRILPVIFFFCFYYPVCSQSMQDTGKVVGKVSHEFKKKGCATVIILQSNTKIILIPREKLPKTFDKNGLKISFNYRRLRIPNPMGCVKGVPAEITNISRKK